MRPSLVAAAVALLSLVVASSAAVRYDDGRQERRLRARSDCRLGIDRRSDTRDRLPRAARRSELGRDHQRGRRGLPHRRRPGGGNDFVAARDGHRDRIVGGYGADRARVDRRLDTMVSAGRTV